MGAEDRSRVVGVLVFLANGISAISIIMVNKQLMSSEGYGFKFATTLSGLHFLFTSLTAKFTTWLIGSDSTDKNPGHLPLFDAVLFAFCADISIVGMNMSLMLNTVGFYQISKLSTIPVICCIDYLWLYKHFNYKTLISICVVLVGVAVSTVSDVAVNTAGTLVAVLAVLSTAMQQFLIGHLQKKHNIGANDLIGTTAPIQAASMLLLGPFIDQLVGGQYPWEYEYHVASMVFLLGSAMLATVVNISQFFCIGRFSAVSFQVLGHSKTVGVLFCGWAVFATPVSWRNFFGMSLAVFGMVFYGVFTVSDPPKICPPPIKPTTEDHTQFQLKSPSKTPTISPLKEQITSEA